MKVTKIYSRRKPNESEITFEEIRSKSAYYLYNKIRMLQDLIQMLILEQQMGKNYT